MTFDDSIVQSTTGFRLSLIIPALNEEDILESTIHEILEKITGRFKDYEIILINDGSTDRTGIIMEKLENDFPSIRMIHHQTNLGLGASYQRGIQEAKFEYVMMLCGDGGFPASSLPPIFQAIGTTDIIIPFMTNLQEIKTPFRYMLSRTYTNLLNLLFRNNIKYYNGLAVHRLDLVRQITITSSGFGFQGEVLIKLLRANCSYVEIGVLGAEKTNISKAVTPKNFINIGKTFSHLIYELIFFDPSCIQREVRSHALSIK